MDQLNAWRAKPLYKELNELRQKYGKVRTFTVEGLPN